MEQVKATLIDRLSNSDDRVRDCRGLHSVLTVMAVILMARYISNISQSECERPSSMTEIVSRDGQVD